MKPTHLSPKRRPDQVEPLKFAEDELKAAQKRIAILERELTNRNDGINPLENKG